MTFCALLKTEPVGPKTEPVGDDLQPTALRSTDEGDDERLDSGIQRPSITSPYKESLYLFFLDNL